MAEKTLKTRIKLLYKPLSEWQSIGSTFYPLKGEVCISSVTQTNGQDIAMLKIGQWDGVDGSESKKSYAELSYIYANASDVYSWAKKENLEFSDLSSDFLAALDARIAEKSENVEYQMVGENGVWKLQKREIGSETWTDVSTVDVASYVTPLINTEKERAEAAEGILQSNIDAEASTRATEDAKKVDKEITSSDGKAIIFNESDGGGAKFEHADGTWSFTGVNNGGTDGLAAQIYAVDSTNGYKGAKLDVTKNGMYYTTGDTSGLPVSQRDVAANELVTRKDLAGGTHYIGSTTLASGETYQQAIDRLMTEKSHTPVSGDIVIIKSSDSDKEFIYDGESWTELGDQGLYATKAELASEASARQSADTTLQTNIDTEAATRASADTTLQTNIDAEASARQTADATLQGNIDTEAAARQAADSALDERLKKFELPAEPEVKTINNINYLFANGVSIRIEDNATENIAYYCTAEGVQKSITFPYQSVVHGGGLGTSTKSADINSTLVIMNSGKVKNIYGGSRDYGNVSVATVIVNDGTLQEGVIGGGAAGSANMVNSVGLANITLNGGTSLMTYGGGMGLATVGKVNMLVNGGTQRWLTAGGANGTTGSANVTITGGTITCLQAVNRGVIQDATITISGGTITNVYGGGETGDSSVTGKCEKTILHIEKAFGGTLNKGTYGGVEDASRVTGDYVETTITAAEAAACNLTVRKYAGLADIAYSGNVNDLIQSSGDVLILNCNI